MNLRNLFGTVTCALSVLATSSAAALGRNDPVDYGLRAGDGEGLPPPSSATMAGQPQDAGRCDVGVCGSYCCPRWTVSADFIILDRLGGGSQTLVETVPRTVKYMDLFTTPGTEVLNSNDLQQGFCGGPRLGLIRHDDSGCDLEVSYFQIGGWQGDKTVVPDPADWLVMRAPGYWLFSKEPWIQTNQSTTQAMAWEYATELYNAELNAQWNACYRVTMLAGFRWVRLHEDLVGALAPPTVSGEPPFWNGTTTNNLYGCQIGADAKILERGRFSIDGLAKAGIFDNDAEQTTAVSVIHKSVYSASASTNHAAFVGETGLQCEYRVTEHLSLRAGYEVLWLEGVALAPGQIQETYVATKWHDSSVRALGINCNSGAFYHGATAGLEYSF
ncbi:MAG: BBP7 family outer membrane beta-barrel protein [Thermoguttaceae bacterium]